MRLSECLQHTLLLVDLNLDVDVDSGNDQIASDVKRTNAVEDIRVFEGNALRHLHHPEDDYDVDTVACACQLNLTGKRREQRVSKRTFGG